MASSAFEEMHMSNNEFSTQKVERQEKINKMTKHKPRSQYSCREQNHDTDGNIKIENPRAYLEGEEGFHGLCS
ncbi:unnamed protein product [Dovyalis caffra]|uniref:Uncharacterized protein n=1 Tax=Dovyalis caffra TaxID=77055 RepID=A0AAV1S8Q2_9ROSI|nr:unnamed protein product [Dovyalis caffra]